MWLVRFRDAFDEGDGGYAAVHAAALMRPAVMVALYVCIENRLHLVDGVEPSATALDAEVFVEERATQPLDTDSRVEP
jgi:hypothetical protein